MWAASIAAARARASASGPNCAKIHLNLYSRSSTAAARGASDSRFGQLRGDPRAGPRVAEVLRPDRDQAGSGGEEFGGVGAAGDPAHADRRAVATAARRRAAAAARSGAPPGPRGRRDRRPAPGAPLAGSIALAFSVLISETASAPPSSAATATAAGSATLGVSFTISGFAVSGRSASSSASVSLGCSPTIRPEWTLGQETLSSIAATSSRSADRLDQARELLAAGRHHRDDQRHRQLGQLRQVLGQEAFEPLVRQPDRVDHPRRGLPDPLRRVAGARLGGDRLRDEGREGEVLEQRVAEDAAGGDRVVGAGGVDHRVGELDAAEIRHGLTSATVARRAHARGPSTQRRR